MSPKKLLFAEDVRVGMWVRVGESWHSEDPFGEVIDIRTDGPTRDNFVLCFMLREADGNERLQRCNHLLGMEVLVDLNVPDSLASLVPLPHEMNESD